MTRITSFLSSRTSDNECGDLPSAPGGWPRFARHDNNFSTSQLQLDAAISSFSSEATNLSSIASFTFVGLVGKFARLGILSSLGRHTGLPLQNFISHLGSVAAEAATMTSISRGGSLWPPAPEGQAQRPTPTQEFLKHFINFGIFRLTGGMGAASGALARTGEACLAPTQHLIQSLAMMAGYQLATFAGLEEKSQKSLLQQFLDANLSTLQISVGSTLAGGLSGHRIHNLERILQATDFTFSPRRFSNNSEINPKESALSFQASDNATLDPRKILALQALAHTAENGDLSAFQTLYSRMKGNPHDPEVLIARDIITRINPEGRMREEAQTNLRALLNIFSLAFVGNLRACRIIKDFDGRNYIPALRSSPTPFPTFALFTVGGIFGLPHFEEALREAELLPSTINGHPLWQELPPHSGSRAVRLLQVRQALARDSHNFEIARQIEETFYHLPFHLEESFAQEAIQDSRVFNIVTENFLPNMNFKKWLEQIDFSRVAKYPFPDPILAMNLTYIVQVYNHPPVVECLKQRTEAGDADSATILKNFHFLGHPDTLEILTQINLDEHIARYPENPRLAQLEFFALCAFLGNERARTWIDETRNSEISHLLESMHRRFTFYRDRNSLKLQLNRESPALFSTTQMPQHLGVIAGLEAWRELSEDERERFRAEATTRGFSTPDHTSIPPTNFMKDRVRDITAAPTLGLSSELWNFAPIFDHYQTPEGERPAILRAIQENNARNPNANLQNAVDIITNWSNTGTKTPTSSRRGRPRSRRPR